MLLCILRHIVSNNDLIINVLRDFKALILIRI